MTWQIKKLSYSRNPWRLVNQSGDEAATIETIDHPDLGRTQISASVSGQTKEELIGKVMKIIEVQRTMIEELRQRIKELTK